MWVWRDHTIGEHKPQSDWLDIRLKGVAGIGFLRFWTEVELHVAKRFDGVERVSAGDHRAAVAREETRSLCQATSRNAHDETPDPVQRARRRNPAVKLEAIEPKERKRLLV